MKPKENPASVRTGKLLSASGVWILRCMKDGCNFVEKLSLREGEPAPPCRRCLNPAWVRFLHEPALVEPPAVAASRPMEEKTIAPAAPPAEGTFIRTLEIVPESGTWLIRCSRESCGAVEKKFQHKGTWADPCPLCQSPARLSLLPEPAPGDTRITGMEVSWDHKIPMPSPDIFPLDQIRERVRSPGGRVSLLSQEPKVEAAPIAEEKPSLFDRLKPKKSGDQKSGARPGGKTSGKEI
ncbi:MAG: hypothetical protein DMG44_14435 [Acidobacteria bacterium]|nr:MAG: hypothetical protein DMG44_14435 [Acidobacteriota bacterium]